MASPRFNETHKVVPFFLEGVPHVPKGSFDVISPLTNEVCWQSAFSTEEDALAAVESAAKSLKSWRKTRPNTRRDILLRAADILEQRESLCKQLTQTETGESDAMFAFEYKAAVQLLRYTAGLVSTLHGILPEVNGDVAHAMVLKEPYGVILSIGSWNAPHALGLRSCVLPLAAGNTVVLKGPEKCPATYFNFVDALHEAGLPQGCLNTVIHKPADAASITKLLIEHPAIQKVNFTGSTAVGSVIAGLSGKALKPCVMELGGKAPAIVCDDADLKLAAASCAFGAFNNAGQICMSTERIVVFKSIVEDFKAHLRAAMDDRAAAESSAPQLVTETSVSKVQALLKDAVSKGAKPVYGDINAKDQSKSRMQPVILEQVTKEMDIYYTESFGPSVSLYMVDSDDEAIDLANDTPYGLSSAVFTRNLARGFKFAREIVSGAVHINSPTVHDEANLPHGGVKHSGFGRFAGKDGLEEWLRPKVVTWQEEA